MSGDEEEDNLDGNKEKDKPAIKGGSHILNINSEEERIMTGVQVMSVNTANTTDDNQQ